MILSMLRLLCIKSSVSVELVELGNAVAVNTAAVEGPPQPGPLGIKLVHIRQRLIRFR